jgi:hypothetical protein
VAPKRSALGHLCERGKWHQKSGDLAGKIVGELAMCGHDAGVGPKGILSDEFRVTPDQCRWIVGRIDFPMKPVECPHFS